MKSVLERYETTMNEFDEYEELTTAERLFINTFLLKCLLEDMGTYEKVISQLLEKSDYENIKKIFSK